MVARFVEDQDVALAEHHARHAQPRPLAPGEDRNLLVDVIASKQQRRSCVEQLLRLGPQRSVLFEVLENCLLIGQARVDVLGVDPDLTAVSPSNLTLQGWQ